jgi:FMN phosphatase YigB (HAD superfamily)
MLIPETIDWIFFDCFNTLIDDFDETVDESGIAPMYQVPVEVGLYDNREAFRQDYHRWRKAHISGKAREQSIEERLRNVLITYRPHSAAPLIDQAVQLMATQFATCYPKTLRLPVGVKPMLAHWQGKVRMGVVSNFFLSPVA